MTAATDVLAMTATVPEDRWGGRKLGMAHHSLTETLHLGRLKHILSTRRRLSLAAGAPGGVGDVTSSDDRAGGQTESNRTSAQ